MESHQYQTQTLDRSKPNEVFRLTHELFVAKQLIFEREQQLKLAHLQIATLNRKNFEAQKTILELQQGFDMAQEQKQELQEVKQELSNAKSEIEKDKRIASEKITILRQTVTTLTEQFISIIDNAKLANSFIKNEEDVEMEVDTETDHAEAETAQENEQAPAAVINLTPAKAKIAGSKSKLSAFKNRLINFQPKFPKDKFAKVEIKSSTPKSKTLRAENYRKIYSTPNVRDFKNVQPPSPRGKFDCDICHKGFSGCYKFTKHLYKAHNIIRGLVKETKNCRITSPKAKESQCLQPNIR